MSPTTYTSWKTCDKKKNFVTYTKPYKNEHDSHKGPLSYDNNVREKHANLLTIAHFFVIFFV